MRISLQQCVELLSGQLSGSRNGLSGIFCCFLQAFGLLVEKQEETLRSERMLSFKVNVHTYQITIITALKHGQRLVAVRLVVLVFLQALEQLHHVRDTGRL